jgi:VWFA-related protein
MAIKQVLTALLALFVCGLSAVAQETQDPETTIRERLEVTEVLLDVVVTDSSGNIIIGLKPEDFIITDGDRQVRAKTAVFYSNRRFVDSGISAERLGVAEEEVVSDRYFIFFFHDQRFEDPSLTANILDAIRWSKDWVRYESLANDWIAILSYDASLKVHQDFTNNRELLLRALDSVAKSKSPENTWPSRIEEVEGASLRQGLPQGKELRKQTRRIYSALSTVAEATGDVVGRKNLLFFSVGFGQLREGGNYAPDVRYWGPMMEAMNDNNVAVYAISWIRNIAQESAAQGALNNSLSLLAVDTGGRYFANFVNFKEPLSKVNEDNNGYYLLSYDAEYPAGKRGFREVEVRVDNPGFNVRARKGYSYGDGPGI